MRGGLPDKLNIARNARLDYACGVAKVARRWLVLDSALAPPLRSKAGWRELAFCTAGGSPWLDATRTRTRKRRVYSFTLRGSDSSTSPL